MQDTSFVARAVESIAQRCRILFAAEAKRSAANSARPTRLVNPRNAPASVGKVFKLHASPSCELTQWLDGRLFSCIDAIPLPMPGCNRAACSCHYEPVRDRRNGERRMATDRRDAIRFEDKADRRDVRVDRRNRSAWDAAAV